MSSFVCCVAIRKLVCCVCLAMEGFKHDVQSTFQSGESERFSVLSPQQSKIWVLLKSHTIHSLIRDTLGEINDAMVYVVGLVNFRFVYASLKVEIYVIWVNLRKKLDHFIEQFPFKYDTGGFDR